MLCFSSVLIVQPEILHGWGFVHPARGKVCTAPPGYPGHTSPALFCLLKLMSCILYSHSRKLTGQGANGGASPTRPDLSVVGKSSCSPGWAGLAHCRFIDFEKHPKALSMCTPPSSWNRRPCIPLNAPPKYCIARKVTPWYPLYLLLLFWQAEYTIYFIIFLQQGFKYVWKSPV